MPNPLFPNTPTYNPFTYTYTDSSGNQQSRPPQNVPQGTQIVLNTPSNNSSSGGSGGGSSRNRNRNSNNPQTPQTPQTPSTPQKTPKQEEKATPITQTPKASVFIPQLGGVYTNTGLFYPTDKDFTPKGFQKGFADIRENSVVVIPNRLIPYAQSSQEGVIITKPQFNDTGVSKAPIKEPEIKNVATSGKEPLVTYKDYTKNEGYAGGTLSYFGGRISAMVDRYQLRSGDYYQQEAFRNIGELAPQSAYFTPYLGTALMIGGGTEKFFKSDTIKEKGLAVGEVGLGIFGLKSEISALKTARELKQFENANSIFKGVRIEGEKGGVDIGFFGKATDKNIYVSKIETPFYKLNNDRFLIEGGKSTTLSFNPSAMDKIRFSIADLSGTGKAIDKSPTYSKLKLQEPYLDTQPTIFSQQLDEYKSFIGNTKTDVKFQGTLKEQKNPNDLFNFEKMFSVKGERGDTYRSAVMGGSKFDEETGIINFFSNRVRGVKVPTENPFLSTKAVSNKPNVFGELRVLRLNEPSESFFFNSGVGTKTKTTPSTTQSFSEDSMRSLITGQKEIQVPKTSPSSITSLETTKTSEVNTIAPSQSLKVETKQKETVSFGIASLIAQTEVQSSRVRQRENNIFGLSSRTPQAERTRENQILGFSTAQIQRQEERQQNKTRFTPRTNSIFNSNPRPKEDITPFSGFNDDDEGDKKKEGFGFLAFLKRRGKYIQLSKPVSKSQALLIGSSAARNTLGRTFKIAPTNIKINSGKEFNVNLSSFRTFVQKNGRRSSLDNTYIQKASSNLFGSLGEKRELRELKRSRSMRRLF